eukprot:scaffold1525_cov142-Cylindrotheca_fusiformis.AAC.143
MDVDSSESKSSKMLSKLSLSPGCQFLYFSNNGNQASNDLNSPFEGATEAYVGIFHFQIEEINFSQIPKNCKGYDSKFDTKFEALIASQVLAIVAPCFAAIALVFTLVETFCIHYMGIFLLTAFLFLVSAAIQAGTFAVFAEPSFCIDAPHDCSVGSAGIQSAVAAVIYWLCCVFTCCFPRPDPFCDSRRNNRKEGVEEEVVSVQRRVYLEPDVEKGFDETQKPKEDEKKKKKKSKKKKKKKRKSNDGKITDDDFDTPHVSDDVDHIEYKETALPNGGRRVDEITHFLNGRQAVKTKRYGPGE